MKRILLASVLLCASAMAAQAESFTFEGTNKTTSALAVPMPGNLAVANTSEGETTTTYASGKTEKITNKCSAQTRAPGDQFDLTGICNSQSPSGTFGLTFACNNVNPEKFTAMCWGILTGLTGDYKGRVGAVSWTGTGNAERTSNTAAGGGAWFD